MNKEAFISYLLTNLPSVMGDDYNFKIIHTVKSDAVHYDSLEMSKKDKSKNSLGVSVNIDALYDEYLIGCTMGDIMLKIVKAFEKPPSFDIDFDLNGISDFNYASQKLIVRAINYENNKKLLNSFVHRRNGDIAITLYLLMGNGEKGLSSAKVSNGQLMSWGVEEDYVMNLAFENSTKLFKPVITDMMSMLMSKLTSPQATVKGGNFYGSCPNAIDILNVVFSDSLNLNLTTGVLVTNERGINGATSAFYDGVLQKLSNYAKDDLLIAFTSIHEAIVHSASQINESDLRGTLKRTNMYDKAQGKDTFLTDKIYFYDRKKKLLEMRL